MMFIYRLKAKRLKWGRYIRFSWFFEKDIDTNMNQEDSSHVAVDTKTKEYKYVRICIV